MGAMVTHAPVHVRGCQDSLGWQRWPFLSTQIAVLELDLNRCQE